MSPFSTFLLLAPLLFTPLVSSAPAPIPATSSFRVPIRSRPPSTTSSSISAGPSPVGNTTAPARGSTPSTGSGSGSTIKKGLGYNNLPDTTAFGNKVSWIYNWYSAAGGSVASGIEYVPMLWGLDSSLTSVWNTNAEAAIKSGSTHLLAFNEPDLSSQSNISPQAAANAYKQYMQPFAGKAKLVSPAVTNGSPPSAGTGWLDTFLSECTGCTIDKIAVHIYASGSNPQYFQTYLQNVIDKYQKPVWVTELGATPLGGNPQDTINFMQVMLPWLDQNPGIERYSYFGDFVGTFVNSDESLTALGNAYATIS